MAKKIVFIRFKNDRNVDVRYACIHITLQIIGNYASVHPFMHRSIVFKTNKLIEIETWFKCSPKKV